MKTRFVWIKKLLAAFVALTVFVAAVPVGLVAFAAPTANYTTLADASTANGYVDMLGTDADGNRYSGRVWVDKSVYTDASVTLDGNTVQNDDDFMVVYSALGSSTSLTTETVTNANLDVVFVLDTSISMTGTRIRNVVSAANILLEGLSGSGNRIAVVDYNASAGMIAPLSAYTDLSLSVSNGVVTATDNGTRVGSNDGHSSGTYTQSGVDYGFEILENATDKTGRAPILIVLSDGLANYATSGSWYAPGASKNASNVRGSGTSGIILSTLLGGAFKKSSVEKAYDRTAYVYGISVEVDDNDSDVIMDPANNFKADSNSSNGRTAYTWFQNWANATQTYSNGSWSFEQVPTGTVYNPNGVTKQDVIDKIAYVDEHYSANDTTALEETFEQILTELKTPAFFPVVDKVTTGTGTVDVPLTYVDFIGEYMEVKSLKAITLFGKTYAIGAGTAGAPTYTTGEKLTQTTVTTYPVGVGAATVKHPTLNNVFTVENAVWLTITEEVTGAYNAGGDFVPDSVPLQTLRVYVKADALPVILDEVDIATNGSITFAETAAQPIRAYYTVGVADAICKADGNVDLSNVDDAYIAANTDATTGRVLFYANRYGEMNAAQGGIVTNGDAHVSFAPSAENRYYYHQNSYAVFFDVKDAQGNPLVADPDEYGVEYNQAMDGYQYDYLDADDIFEWQGNTLVQKIVDDDHPLYTYIEYYHKNPTTGEGELVYLLAFATWGELKNDLTAVRLTGQTQNGQALHEYIVDNKTVFTVEDLREYIEDNHITDLTTIRARMAVGTERIYRLHHMIEKKGENVTDTAVNAYAPDYNKDVAHVGSIVVWLGNNGVLSAEPEELSIAIQKTVVGNDASSDEFTFTVTSASAADNGLEVALTYYDADGNEAAGDTAEFVGGKITVTIGAGEKVVITGLTKDVDYTVTETANALYDLTSVNGNSGATSVVLKPAVGELATASFTNTAKEFGNLVINKEVLHAFGTGYAVPENVEFAIRTHLALNGENVANATFNATYSDERGDASVMTDENGNFIVMLAHGESVEIFGLEAGTVANGTEVYFDGTAYYEYGQAADKWYVGFTAPTYYDDDDAVNGQADIVADTTVAGMVYNTYSPAPVDATIKLSGEKTVQKEAGAVVTDDFTFQLQRWNGTRWVEVETVTAKDGEAITFSNQVFNFTAPGKYSYQVVEIAGNNGGITYDPNIHTFTVTVTDENLDGQLEVKSVESDHADDNGFVKESEGVFANSHIDFTNYYQSHDALAQIDIQKQLVNASGSLLADLEGYRFDLIDLRNNQSVAHSFTDAVGEARLFWWITEDGSATYEYHLVERNDGQVGMTYADPIKVFVTVTDDGAGNKAVTAIAMENGQPVTDEIVVRNTYAPTTAEVTPLVYKTLNGRDMAADEFTFELKQVIHNNEPYVKTIVGGQDQLLTAAGITAKNPAAADGQEVQIPFPTLKFEQVGNYYFTVDELGEDGNGLTYDHNVYHIHVTVTDNGGTLTAATAIYDQMGDESELHFVNTYTAAPTAPYAVEANKQLVGRELKDGEFAFTLVGEDVSYTVANDADGNVVFPEMTFDAAGVYAFELTEVNGGTSNYGDPGYNGIAYDGNIFRYTIEVVDNGLGQLVVDSVDICDVGYYPVDGEPTFVNRYIAYGLLTIGGIKLVNNGTLGDGEFAFALYAADENGNKLADEPILTEQNSADGSFKFRREYQLDIDNGVNELGKHYYVVEEVDGGAFKVDDQNETGMLYDDTRFLVVANVADNGDGTLAVSASNINLSSGALYHTIRFVNSVYDIASKEVYGADAEMNIDGNTVSVGEQLTYVINYYNGNDDKVTVEIVDTIPNGTTYVECSANYDGVYADGEITWTLTVPARTRMSVKFSVTVTAGVEEIANEATVIDGGNVYVTNEVVNDVDDPEPGPTTSTTQPTEPTASVTQPTVPGGAELTEPSAQPTEPTASGTESTTPPTYPTAPDEPGSNPEPEVPDVPEPDVHIVPTPGPCPKPDPEPESEPTPEKPADSDDLESPKTGDSNDLALWIALAFVSGGVMLGTTKKKKKEEI